MASTLKFEDQMKTIFLHKLKVDNQTVIPQHMLDTARIDILADQLACGFKVYMSAFLSCAHWSEKYGEPKYERIPLTWVDAFRLRFFPNLLAKHYPIKYRQIQTAVGTTNNYWIFPEIPPNTNPEITDFAVAYRSSKCFPHS